MTLCLGIPLVKLENRDFQKFITNNRSLIFLVVNIKIFQSALSKSIYANLNELIKTIISCVNINLQNIINYYH